MPSMIRNLVTIAQDMEDAAALYGRVMGVKVGWRTRMDQFGLLKLVMPAGRKTFLEILQPFDPNSRAGRFLRDEGEYGGRFFSLIPETDDLRALRTRAEKAKVRITSGSERAFFLHPVDMTGVLIEVQQPPRGTWPNSGPEETQRKAPGAVVTQLRQVAVLVNDLDDAIRRWSAVFQLKVSNRSYDQMMGASRAVLPFGKSGTFLELVTPGSPFSPLRWTQEQWKRKGGTGEGLYAAVLQVRDLAAVERRIRKLGNVQYTRQDSPRGGTRTLWLHPRSMRGALFGLTEVTSATSTSSWPPAGGGWNK